jgi:acetoin utilization deacetylase AcuC-like enzyme
MKIPVFFNNKMVVTKRLETPSPRKPLEVVTQWIDKYPIEILDFNKLEISDFYLAHEKVHVNNIIELRTANGMDTKDQEIVDSLYWTSGSFFAAAEYALQNKVAVSPTSGFHHAGYDYSWGFCTFNGLLITAIKLLNSKKVKKIGILDFDYHQGDGSENIIEKLKLNEKIIHITGKTSYSRNSDLFFSELPFLLESLRDVDIILYQAGADQHIHDPLGGFLDNDELALRDKCVFNFSNDNRIPIVWNLAGGYQENIVNGIPSIQKVLDIHNTTMEECIKVFIK